MLLSRIYQLVPFIIASCKLFLQTVRHCNYVQNFGPGVSSSFKRLRMFSTLAIKEETVFFCKTLLKDSLYRSILHFFVFSVTAAKSFEIDNINNVFHRFKMRTTFYVEMYIIKCKK